MHFKRMYFKRIYKFKEIGAAVYPTYDGAEVHYNFKSVSPYGGYCAGRYNLQAGNPYMGVGIGIPFLLEALCDHLERTYREEFNFT